MSVVRRFVIEYEYSLDKFSKAVVLGVFLLGLVIPGSR